ncbi:hypothetical protein GQ457_03G034060 [Hibiscus cannabinus]
MPERNLASWEGHDNGLCKEGLGQEALQLMYRMEAEGLEVDDYILTTVLRACGDIDFCSVTLSKIFFRFSSLSLDLNLQTDPL